MLVADTIALRDVQLIAPSAVRLGDTVQLGCKWTLEGNETLYSVKWYRGRQEFFSFLPKEYPFTRIFAQPGIDVDVSRSTSQQVVLRDATRALAGRYRCEVSADAPSFHTQVRSAFIHVVVEQFLQLRKGAGRLASGYLNCGTKFGLDGSD
ncbi:unnamed protein product [Chilo suppressalis]|uniref:Immunoglobulin domain-containing protein n=1 Tax=Chilo suppressalis TaxID=168631 RepID=A0ABN8BJI2_CHISP|nr:unnamed protein product [Chilo suppressalis]